MRSFYLTVLLSLLLVFSISTHAQDEDTPALPELQVITPENASQLEPLLHLGEGRISDLIWSNDSTKLGVATTHGAWLFEAETMEILWEARFVYAQRVAFSTDDALLAVSGIYDIKIFDVATGDLLTTLDICQVRGLEFTDEFPDGEWEKVEVSPDYWLAYLPSGTCLPISTVSMDITAEYSNDLFEVTTLNNDLTLRNLETDTVQELSLQGEAVVSIAISPDNQLLILGTVETWRYQFGYIQLFDIETLEERGEISEVDGYGFSTRVSILQYSPDGERLATVSGASIYLWRIGATGESSEQLANGTITSFVTREPDMPIGTSQDGSLLIFQPSLIGSVFVRDAETMETVTSLRLYNETVRLIPDSDEIIYTMTNYPDVGQLAIWDFVNDETRIIREAEAWWHVRFSPDGQLLYIVEAPYDQDETDRILIYDLQTDDFIATFDGTNPVMIQIGETTLLAYHILATVYDRSRTITYYDQSTVHLVNVVTNTKLAVFEGYEPHFSPDNTALVYLQADGSIHVWDIETGEERLTFSYPELRRDFRFNADGTLISTRAYNNTQIWDVNTGELLADMPARGAFNPDWSLFAAIEYIGEIGTLESNGYAAILIWDTSTGEQIATIPIYGGMPYVPVSISSRGIYFNMDGTLLTHSDYDLNTGSLRWGVPAD